MPLIISDRLCDSIKFSAMKKAQPPPIHLTPLLASSAAMVQEDNRSSFDDFKFLDFTYFLWSNSYDRLKSLTPLKFLRIVQPSFKMDAAELAKKTVKDLKKELTDRSRSLLATLIITCSACHSDTLSPSSLPLCNALCPVLLSIC